MTSYATKTRHGYDFAGTSRTGRLFAIEHGRQFNSKATAAVA